MDGDKAVGFELEIFAAVMGMMKYPVVFINRPWKRCLYMVKEGEADAVISALYTTERATYMYFPKEFISLSKTAFFTTTNRSIEFNGLYRKLKNYNIGVIRGFSYGPDFDAATYLVKEETATPELLVKKLIRGRNNLAVGNIAVISSIAEKLNVKNSIKFLKPLVHSQQLFVGFSKKKGNKKISQDFSTTLSKFKKLNAYKDILTKYGVPTTK